MKKVSASNQPGCSFSSRLPSVTSCLVMGTILQSAIMTSQALFRNRARTFLCIMQIADTEYMGAGRKLRAPYQWCARDGRGRCCGARSGASVIPAAQPRLRGAVEHGLFRRGRGNPRSRALGRRYGTGPRTEPCVVRHPERPKDNRDQGNRQRGAAKTLERSIFDSRSAVVQGRRGSNPSHRGAVADRAVSDEVGTGTLIRIPILNVHI